MKCSCTISGTILTFIKPTLYLSGQPGSRTIMLAKCDNVAPNCPLQCYIWVVGCPAKQGLRTLFYALSMTKQCF